MPIHSFPLGPLDTNCHVIVSGPDAVVVDPGGDFNGGGLEKVNLLVKENALAVRAIICTHFHFDHIYGVASLSESTGAPVYAPEGDAFLLGTELGGGGAWGYAPVRPFEWKPLKEGPMTFGSIELTVLHTPGHTPGSVSLYVPAMKSVLTGDLLFYRSVGRTDFPGSSQHALVQSLRRKIFSLPPETEVFPGHGPNTNVGDEEAQNPYMYL